jgi:hypothetical protein
MVVPRKVANRPPQQEARRSNPARCLNCHGTGVELTRNIHIRRAGSTAKEEIGWPRTIEIHCLGIHSRVPMRASGSKRPKWLIKAYEQRCALEDVQGKSMDCSAKRSDIERLPPVDQEQERGQQRREGICLRNTAGRERRRYTSSRGSSSELRLFAYIAALAMDKSLGAMASEDGDVELVEGSVRWSRSPVFPSGHKMFTPQNPAREGVRKASLAAYSRSRGIRLSRRSPAYCSIKGLLGWACGELNGCLGQLL